MAAYDSTLIYGLATVAISTAGAAFSYLTSSGKSRLGSISARTKILEEIQFASSEVMDFYEAFKPPLRIGNRENTLMIAYFTMWILGTGIILAAFIFNIVIGLPYLFVLPLVPELILIFLLPKFLIKRVSNISELLEKDEFGRNVINEIGVRFLIVRVVRVYVILGLSIFYVFLMAVAPRNDGALTYILFAYLATIGILVILPIMSLFGRTFLQLETQTFEKFLFVRGRNVLVKGVYAPARGDHRTFKGKLVTISKSMSLVDEENYVLSIKLKDIESLSFLEVPTVTPKSNGTTTS